MGLCGGVSPPPKCTICLVFVWLFVHVKSLRGFVYLPFIPMYHKQESSSTKQSLSLKIKNATEILSVPNAAKVDCTKQRHLMSVTESF